MELFSIPCSTCGARLKVKSQAAIGQIFNCPKCQSMVLVEPPAGWTPPVIEPATPRLEQPLRRPAKPSQVPVEANSSSAQVPEAIEMPVATLEEPPASDADPLATPWQSPAEARWRRGAMIGAGITVFFGLLVAAWLLGRQNPSTEVLVKDDAPAEEIAEASSEPTPTIAETVAASESPPPQKIVPRRWLPAETRLLLSLPLAELAGHEVAPEILASGNSPLRETLAELRRSFHLAPEQIRRLTWAATEESTDLRHAVVVIELAEPLEDDAALLAGCRRLDLRLADAFCHQAPNGGWPHPFAVVDPQTIVTGPRELLATVSLVGESAEPSSLVAALNESGAHDVVLAIDIKRWPFWDQLQWPTSVEDWSGLGETWPRIKEATEFAALKLQLAEKPLASLHLTCVSPESAQEIHAALAATAGKSIENSKLVLDGPRVSLQGEWPGEARQLTANLIAGLPTWVAPPAALASVPTEPVRPAIEATSPPAAAAPAATAAATKETAFERQVARKFEERIPAIVLRGMKLGEFAGFVSRMTGVTITLDDAALAAAGVNSQTVIEVELTAATVGEIFAAALAARELDFLAEESRLLITTRAKASAVKDKK